MPVRDQQINQRLGRISRTLRSACGMIAGGEMSGDASQEKVRVGLLGIGLMGSAMAHRLLAQGIGVVAWDRDG